MFRASFVSNVSQPQLFDGFYEFCSKCCSSVYFCRTRSPILRTAPERRPRDPEITFVLVSHKLSCKSVLLIISQYVLLIY